MPNVIRAELYKLKCSKFLRVLLMIDFALSIAVTLLTFFIPDIMNGSIRVSGSRAVFDFLPLLSFFIIMMLAVFSSMSITCEFSDGTVRNAISAGVKRWQFFLVKWIASFVVNISLVIFAAAVVITANTILNGWQEPMMLDRAVLVTGACILLVSGHIAMFHLVAFLVHNPGAAVGINMFLFLAQLMIVLRLGEKIQFYDLLLIPYLLSCATHDVFPDYYYSDLFRDTLLKGLLLTAVIIAVTTAVGCLGIKRHEIK